MTYMCGSDGTLAKYGVPAGEPRIICNGCGATRPALNPRTMGPYAWLMDGKAAPGWTGGKNPDGTRTDYCRQCNDARERGRGER